MTSRIALFFAGASLAFLGVSYVAARGLRWHQ
jgi:hypothetical protein